MAVSVHSKQFCPHKDRIGGKREAGMQGARRDTFSSQACGLVDAPEPFLQATCQAQTPCWGKSGHILGRQLMTISSWGFLALDMLGGNVSHKN